MSFFLEKKSFILGTRPDPFLFGIMNLMLHGVKEPNIVRANTLETPIADIQENLKVDIVMTNPPFGG
jgi:type I restriction enzyme M protein